MGEGPHGRPGPGHDNGSVPTKKKPNADAIALTTVPNPGADFSQDLAELWLIRPGYAAFELSSQAEPGVL